VLDEEINYKKRLISEMIHIKKQRQGLNLKKDTELLHPFFTMIYLNDYFRNLYHLTLLLKFCVSLTESVDIAHTVSNITFSRL